MSDIIHLLPDSVANQIAAGEVIQRPASVVKELVENAIDAGATQIDIHITDAGKSLIQIVDNGKGMSPTDARMAFERHATSKIKEAQDLFSLKTMGFRGEALASIAAVAQVELKTCTATEEVGTEIHIAGSQVESQTVAACPVGSNFMVKNLFYNVPARRKFLKSNQTELSNILTEIERIVLVNPTVSFKLRHYDSELLNLPPASLKQRIITLFGKKMNQDLLSIQTETSMVRIHGFVGRKEAARKKGAKQFFFVNGRYMRHPYFHKAVMECYEQLLLPGEQVPYFLYFEIDPASIDVNIHPTKTEIKFENEQAVWQIIVAAIREALGKFQSVPSIDFDTEGKPDIPVYYDDPTTEFPEFPTISVDDNYNPFQNNHTPPTKTGSREWNRLFEGLEKPAAGRWENLEPAIEEPTEETLQGTLYTEQPISYAEKGTYLHYKKTYIITLMKRGVAVIDQHRAHLSILFHKYLNLLREQERFTSQRLLFPELIHFSVAERPIIEMLQKELYNLGFEIDNLGNGTYSISSVPSGTESFNPETLLYDIVQGVIEKDTQVRTELEEIMALTLARTTAISIGQDLSTEEMESLVAQLLALPSPHYTPDGKTVISFIEEDTISKLFGR
ncbi:MAG: DNA mismatch repair endonuclease MutL [Phocaeicola sp.]|nr:DNA mismatch repair endonuclease MutL [Phocaeicola sp.]